MSLIKELDYGTPIRVAEQTVTLTIDGQTVSVPAEMVIAPPVTVTIHGSPFVTWRGIPLVPSDKVQVKGGKTSILLLRTGEARQGVVGLFQPNLPGAQGVGLSVRFMGINRKAIASYLISLYCSLAVLTDDALAVLENVDVTQYHVYDGKHV